MPVQMPVLYRKSVVINYYNFIGKKHHLMREYGIMLVTAHIDGTCPDGRPFDSGII